MMEFLYAFYFRMPRPAFLGKLNKAADRIMAFVIKRIMDRTAVPFLRRTAPEAGYGLNTEPRDIPFMVSMTSFPGRIEEVWVTVETLLRQVYKPDGIILWLSEVQFPDRKIPDSLNKLKARGLTVEFVPDDIRSHKKYFYAFGRFPQAAIVTVDDDVYYPKDTLRYLADAHKLFPGSVIANRAHAIKFVNGQVKPYRQWSHNEKRIKDPSYLLVPTGVGGVLYPPQCYHTDIFDEKTFREICFMADDLWLKIATVRKHVKVATTPFFTRDLITTGKTQDIKLVADNSHGGGNDRQLKNICDHYGLNLYEITQ